MTRFFVKYPLALIVWSFFSGLFLWAESHTDCRGRGRYLCEASFDENGKLTPWSLIYGGIYGLIFGAVVLVILGGMLRISLSMFALACGFAVTAYLFVLMAFQIFSNATLGDSNVVAILAATGVWILSLAFLGQHDSDK